MPVGYRSIVQLEDRVADVARSEFDAWLRHKKVMNAPSEPGLYLLDDDQRLTIVELTPQDGSQSVRYRLEETNSAGRWVTTVTAHQYAEGRSGRGHRSGRTAPAGWFWVDVEAPPVGDNPGRGELRWGSKYTAPPKLVRNVLGRCEARDGQAHLSDRPRLVLEDEVEELIDVMCDPDRHGPAFVAGAAPTADQDAWVERVGRATHQTVGLGATYVLSEGAAVGLREQVGVHHAVPQGAVRTYLPEVDPASLVDARRHRLMTARTFELTDPHRTTRTLAAAARRATLGRPLPKLVARVDQVLKGAEPDLVSEWAARSAAGVSGPRRTGVAPVDSVPVGAAEVVTDATRTAMRVAETETQHEVLAVVSIPEREVTGTVLEQTDVFALAVRDLVAEFAAPIGELEIATEGPVDPVVLQEQLLTLLLAGRSSALSQRELRRRLDDLQTAVVESEEAREEQAALLEDEQLANAETQDELRRVLRDRERLRLLVAQSDSGAAWDEDHSEPESPDSFTELLEWWAEGRLTGVVWTGDDSVAQALDDNDPLGTWAGRAWDALRALSGYTEVCAQAEGFAGGVHQYLKETPAGYPGFSANKHVPVESQTVLTNQKWRAERVLPVPSDVCPEGQVLMQSHMRIGARSTIAPRLHYYDDTSGTGKVYVGYLGRHLHNTKTN